MRVLIASDDWDDPRVGAAKAPRKLAQALERAGHKVDLVFNGDLRYHPRNERLRYLVAPWYALSTVRRRWRERGPYDVIDMASSEGWLVFLAHRLGAFRGAAMVARTHGLEHIYYRELVADHRAGLLRKPWPRRIWYPVVKLSQVAASFRLADHAILLNQRSRALVLDRRWKSAGQIALIAHGVDGLHWSSAPPPSAPRQARVLFSGNWHLGKGTAYLAEAHRLLLARGIPMPLTLLGGGTDFPQPEIERHVRASFAPESQPWLTVVERLADEDAVFEFYRNHQFLVCPSTAEGFGMVVFEAMSQRMPVVASLSVGAAERLTNGINALLVPPRDAAALADAMARLWHEPALRQNLGENGHAFVRDYTWDRAARETVAVYDVARRTAGADG
ncbi:MAG TPA: glycosyltransferase family 4 protein [Terriglobales bacterium]|nr:glycosyltransferase family 4 protein [Terriglobales bacterium]